MRKLYAFLITGILMATIAACQNNGHIGWLFGVWRVNEYFLDGQQQDDALLPSTTFAFQNNIVEVVAYLDNHNTQIERYGTWEQNGDMFTLNFTHYDDSTHQGTGVYAAPEWLGMTSESPMQMQMTSHKGDKFTVEWIDAAGQKKVYEFEKTW